MVTGKWFDGFVQEDLADADSIRRKVFVEEMGIAEDVAFDGQDPTAVHLVVYDRDMPVACGRMVKDGMRLFFGRVATLPEHRGMGYGDFVVRLLIRKAFDMGEENQYVSAPVAVRGFYEKLGFAAIGDVYEEAGIPHITMVHSGDVGGCC